MCDFLLAGRPTGVAHNRASPRFALYAAHAVAQYHGFVGTPKKHDANEVEKAVGSLVSALADRHKNNGHLLLLGIANGGISLANRLTQALRARGLKCGTGTIDISFHRDDISRHPIPKEFASTLIPHDVNGATVVLVDDVIFSGRTVKAALDELFDHGRPDSVELAVLVDRPGRRLPFSADYSGLKLEAGDDQKVIVHLDNRDPKKDEIVVTSAPVPTNRKSAVQKT
jgi:pyrimidine operon attenuation protein/uracil phosphoribosyltransferase